MNIDGQFSIIKDILNEFCNGFIDVYEDEKIIFSLICVVTFEPDVEKWYLSFDLSVVDDVRISATFALIIQMMWDKGVPVYIAEAYHSIFDDEGFHIIDLWESEIYETMNESGEDYETVKANLIEFYNNHGIRDSIH